MKNKIIINESQYKMLLEYSGYANVWEKFINYVVPILQEKYKKGEDIIIISGHFLKKMGIPDIIDHFTFFIDENESLNGSFYPDLIKVKGNLINSSYRCLINLNKNILFTNKIYSTMQHELTHFYNSISMDKKGLVKKFNDITYNENDNYKDFIELISYYLSNSELNAFISEYYRIIENDYNDYVNDYFDYYDDDDDNEYKYNFNYFREDYKSWHPLEKSQLELVLKNIIFYKNKCIEDSNFINGLIQICNNNKEIKQLFENIYSTNPKIFSNRLIKFLNKNFNYILKKTDKIFERFMYNKTNNSYADNINKKSLEKFNKNFK